MRFRDYLSKLRKVYKSVGRPLGFARPASTTVIDALAAKLNIGLPSELRQAWLTANGSRNENVVFANPGSLTGFALLSVAASKAERKSMQDRAPQYADYDDPEPRNRRLRPGWLHEGWLPFAGFGGGSLLLLVDGSPSRFGKSGQVISFTHDPDEMGYVSPSFESFLEASIAAIEEDPEEVLGCY